MNMIRGAVQYVRNRLNEKSTYGGIVVAIAGAAVLPAPWSYAALAVGLAGVFIPTSSN